MTAAMLGSAPAVWRWGVPSISCLSVLVGRHLGLICCVTSWKFWLLKKTTFLPGGLLGACHSSAANLFLLLKSPLRCHRSLAVIFPDSHNMGMTDVILSTPLFVCFCVPLQTVTLIQAELCLLTPFVARWCERIIWKAAVCFVALRWHDVKHPVAALTAQVSLHCASKAWECLLSLC